MDITTDDVTLAIADLEQTKEVVKKLYLTATTKEAEDYFINRYKTLDEKIAKLRRRSEFLLGLVNG